MTDCGCHIEGEGPAHARVLRTLLAINAIMFVAELGAGLVARSAALVTDSFDMLADAAVYGIALGAVGRGARAQVFAGRASGWLQSALAALAAVEVVRRALGETGPDPAFMIAVSLVALAANAWCLRLIAAHRGGGVHMRASYVFSQNDVIANVAVVVSGVLVALTGARLWDLVTGAGIALLLASGGLRILRDARRAEATPAGAADEQE